MKTLIFTVVDSGYIAYAPLFVRAAKKAYPDYEVLIISRDSLPAWLRHRDNIIHVSDNCRKGSAFTASLRHMIDPRKYVQDCDYTLITDVDMMIVRERNAIRDQHTIQMRNELYENFAVPITRYGYRMPGVHWVHEKWYDATEKMRQMITAHYENQENKIGEPFHNGTATIMMSAHDAREMDEVMLYYMANAIEPPSIRGTETWRWHGLHLGRYKKPTRNIFRSDIMLMAKLLEDEQWFSLATEYALYHPVLKKTLMRLMELNSTFGCK